MKSSEWNNNFLRGVMVFVFIFLLVINVITILMFKKNYEENQMNIITAEKAIEKHQTLSNELKTMFFNNLYSESTQLDPFTILTELESGDIKTMENVVDEGSVLILRFSENTCNVCVERELEKIKKMDKSIDPNKFIIVASYDNIRDINRFKNENGIKFKIYLVDKNSLPIPLEKLNVPYFFIVDFQSIASSIFYPLTSSPSLTDNYFEILKNKYQFLFK